MGLVEDAEEGRLEAVRDRLLAGEEINLRREGETALFCACIAGHEKVVELLLERGASVNCADDYGDLPIHRSLGYGYGGITARLVRAGAELRRRDSEGNTPLHLAVQGRCLLAVQLLLQKGVRPTEVDDGMGYSALHEAALCDMGEAVEALIAAGADVHLPSRRGDTPLHVACKGGSREAARALVANGASDDVENSFGETPRELAEGSGILDHILLAAELKREAEEEAAAAAAEVEAKAKRASRCLIDPTRRAALVALCWACSQTETDPGRVAHMKRCVGCRGAFHASCVDDQETSASVGPGGKWRCPTCVSASRFENAQGYSAVPEEMGPYQQPDGPEPSWPRRLPYQHIQFARDEAVAWGKIPVFLDTKGDSDVDNFFQYQKVQMVEARWCFQVTQIDKSKTVEEVQEHLRKKLVAAMKNGATLWIRMGTTAVNFKETFCHPNRFPKSLFNPRKWLEKKEHLKVVLPEDTEETHGVFILRKGFCVMITSAFDQLSASERLVKALPGYDAHMVLCDVIPESISGDSYSVGGGAAVSASPKEAHVLEEDDNENSDDWRATPGLKSYDLPFGSELLQESVSCLCRASHHPMLGAKPL